VTSRRSRLLLAGGAAGGVLFIAVFVIESLVHPAGYVPLRHTVSAFVLGPHGWVQQLNFVVSGLLLAFSALTVRGAWASRGGGRAVPILLGLVGLGMLGSGFFAADPVAAGVTAAFPYPLGQPVSTARTTHGILHDLCGIPVFLGVPLLAGAAGYRYLRSRRHRWGGWSIGVCLVFLAGFVLTSSALAQPPLIPPVGGLLQRLTLVVGLGWVVAFLLELRQPGAEAAPARRPSGAAPETGP
jgi:uncharacterized protein DUF998